MTTFTEKKAGIIGLVCVSIILISIEFAVAQPCKLTGEITEKEWFQKLPTHMRTLADSAVCLAHDSKYEESIKILQDLLGMRETQKVNRFFRAWLYQWMAYNFYPTDNLDTTRYFVSRSLREDFDIWPDHADSILPIEVRGLYQDRQKEILDQFIKKRRSFRVAIGTITRAEIGYSYRFINVAFGVGTTFIQEIQNILEDGAKSETEFFRDFLLFVRVQGMRKNIKRWTAGSYLEFALLEDLKEEKFKPSTALSAGPIISYTFQSELEVGVSFEVARLDFGRHQDKKFSRTSSQGDVDVSYGNFELYFRKWF